MATARSNVVNFVYPTQGDRDASTAVPRPSKRHRSGMSGTFSVPANLFSETAAEELSSFGAPSTGVELEASLPSAPPVKRTKASKVSADSAAVFVPKPIRATRLVKTSKAPIVHSKGPRIAPQTLATVAFFKGIQVTAIAAALGVPAAAVQGYFMGVPSSLRPAVAELLADVIGVDLQHGRLKDGQVHVFNFDAMPFFSSQDEFTRKLKDLSTLLSDTRVVSLSFPSMPGIKRALTRTVHVAQNNHIRAVFLGSRRAFYSAVMDPARTLCCRWALKTSKASVVPVYQGETCDRLLASDMNPVEFDELFQGKEALAWCDVENMARVHQVSKSDIVAWIESRADKNQAGNKSLTFQQGSIEQMQSLPAPAMA